MAQAVLAPEVRIETTLAQLRTPARVVSAASGPRLVRYGLMPEPGVRVSRLLRSGPDLALALGVERVRLDQDADAVGLEVPRADPVPVPLAPLMAEARWPRSPVAFAVGRDVAGRPVVADLARMPHLLIARATGSGKSVAVNVLLASMLLRTGPERLRLALIDAKRVELAPYRKLPHLLVPVATEPEEAEALLDRLVAIMEARYVRLARNGERAVSRRTSRIVLVVDELADLVLQSRVAAKHLVRLAQKARAAGIHLVLATQRSSADVISGLLKANVPGRMSFATASAVDSRVILDVSGAEDLLGRGDMLFGPPWEMEPVRLQGAYVTDAEIAQVVRRWTPPPPPVTPPSVAPEPAGWRLWPAVVVAVAVVAIVLVALWSLLAG